MSARTIAAFEAHCATQGRPVPEPVDVTGRIPRRGPQSAPARVSVADPSELASGAQRFADDLPRSTTTARSTDDRLAVTLTLGELRELMRGAALEAVAEAANDLPPALLDRAGLARALGVSASTVGRLRREGMPAVCVGDSPRFEIADCLAWLRGRPAP